jgi:hypothetical protein
MRLHGVVLNYLRTGTTLLYFTFYTHTTTARAKKTLCHSSTGLTTGNILTLFETCKVYDVM